MDHMRMTTMVLSVISVRVRPDRPRVRRATWRPDSHIQLTREPGLQTALMNERLIMEICTYTDMTDRVT